MMQGADVSYVQQHLDYAQLQKAGVEFAYAKCTDWSPHSGFFVDSMHDTHTDGFRAQGTWTGSYLFLHTTPSPIAQADFFLEHCDLNQLVPMVDAEIRESDGSIPKMMGAITLACMQRIEQTSSIRPILYGSTYYLAEIVRQAPGLGKYLLWVAEYHNPPSPDHVPRLPAPLQQSQLAIYQWTGSGRLPGCPVEIDRDVLTIPDLDPICC